MEREPTVKIDRTDRGWPNRWYVDVWWDDGDGTGHGVGAWTRTRWGANRAARRIISEEQK